MTNAQDAIRDLFHHKVSASNSVYEFDLFDMSVRQKLWSSDWYRNGLLTLDISNYIIYPSTSSTLSSGPGVAQHPVPDIPRFCYELNRLLDGFVMNSMSVLDTLAHQIFLLYSFPSVPSKIYIHTARDMLLRGHPNCKLKMFLDKQLRMHWLSQFKTYRDCTTHESLIRHDDIQIGYDHITSSYQVLRKIKLPDDPKVRPYSYNKNRIASEYCQSIFQKIVRLIDKAYENILVDIHENGDLLPIP